MEGGTAQEEPLVSCPVCLMELPSARINSHLDSCLQLQGEGEDLFTAEVGGRSHSAPKPPAGAAAAPPNPQQPSSKKIRLSRSPERRNQGEEQPGNDLGSPPVFPLFHRGRNPGGSPAGAPRGAATSPNPGKGEERPGETPERAPGASEPPLRGESLAQKLEGKPLADKLRPSHLGDYVGQNRALGKETLLRSLLEAHEVPSLILWGPPGCGKTTLAHIIASSSKKNGTRFVTLSATSAKTSDVRDVIFQAQNEKRLCKRKTILFIDEIHRFNKSQQDTFLPHVECGTITLIGATTENPSFQVNSALLSRCRVIVLEKLSVEAVEAILMRAVKSLGIQVLSQDEGLTSSLNANHSQGSE
ncbi:PREDICTED: ATPase WRNIP1 [Thamnophis sirtalis]|uniref:ATPase WRNIP1 n=1 Tax=Thamnophis sirtalis TaxID=35019 RepID=A0A6I9Y1I9_9SAUR|nr:PREDICTED: ATPase WRNIP1 [Thamnophis sirtalis]